MGGVSGWTEWGHSGREGSKLTAEGLRIVEAEVVKALGPIAEGWQGGGCGCMEGREGEGAIEGCRAGDGPAEG